MSSSAASLAGGGGDGTVGLVWARWHSFRWPALWIDLADVKNPDTKRKLALTRPVDRGELVHFFGDGSFAWVRADDLEQFDYADELPATALPGLVKATAQAKQYQQLLDSGPRVMSGDTTNQAAYQVCNSSVAESATHKNNGQSRPECDLQQIAADKQPTGSPRHSSDRGGYWQTAAATAATGAGAGGVEARAAKRRGGARTMRPSRLRRCAIHMLSRAKIRTLGRRGGLDRIGTLAYESHSDENSNPSELIELSEYEQLRLQNIQRNNVLLALCGLDKNTSVSSVCGKHTESEQRKSRVLKHPQLSHSNRRSLRLSGSISTKCQQQSVEEDGCASNNSDDSDYSDSEGRGTTGRNGSMYHSQGSQGVSLQFVDRRRTQGSNDDVDRGHAAENLESPACGTRLPARGIKTPSKSKCGRRGKSSYRGVHWQTNRKRWMARYSISTKGVKHANLGAFLDERSAALAWDQEARRRGRPESDLNFPDTTLSAGTVQEMRITSRFHAARNGKVLTSSYRGVSKSKNSTRFVVQMSFKKVKESMGVYRPGPICLGHFVSEIDAALEYDRVALEHGIPSHELNFTNTERTAVLQKLKRGAASSASVVHRIGSTQAHRHYARARSVATTQLQTRPNASVDVTEYDGTCGSALISLDVHDDICCICSNGGELLMCEWCTKVAHVGCAGLQTVPKVEDEWYCPNCAQFILKESKKSQNLRFGYDIVGRNVVLHSGDSTDNVSGKVTSFTESTGMHRFRALDGSRSSICLAKKCWSLAPSAAPATSSSSSKKVREIWDDECPICFEEDLKEPIKTKCKHIFCRPCLASHTVRNGSTCPMCRADIELADVKRITLHRRIISEKRKAVEQLCVDTGGVINTFESVTLAASAVKASVSSISSVCCGKSLSACGFYWRFKGSLAKPDRAGKRGSGHKPVEQLTLDGKPVAKFQSIMDAVRGNTGIRHASISEVCNGNCASAGGFFWRFAGSDEKPRKSYVSVPVQQLCLKSGKVLATYDSVAAAQRAFAEQLLQRPETIPKRFQRNGGTAIAIDAAINGRGASAGGFGWRKAPNRVSKRSHRKVVSAIDASRPVEQMLMQTGALLASFTSLEEAGRVCNIPCSEILSCCKGYDCRKRAKVHGGKRSDVKWSAGGFFWRFTGSNRQPLTHYKRRSGKGVVRIVEKLCLQTGQVLESYPSITAAAEACGTYLHISDVCNGTARSAGGFGWRFQGSELLPQPAPPRTGSVAVHQICLSTGKVVGKFDSINAAAAHVNRQGGNIRQCLIGNVDQSAGFGWQYAHITEKRAQLAKRQQRLRAAAKGRGRRDPNSPKKALPAFSFFWSSMADTLATNRRARGTRGKGSCMVEVAAKWRAATAEEKAPFEEKAKQDKARFDKEFSSYKTTVQYKEWQAGLASYANLKLTKN